MAQSISGVAGVIDVGGRGGNAPAPLEGFAEQLLRIKQLQQQSALQNIDVALQIAATGDVETAEKIGGPAIQAFAKHAAGKESGAPSIFRKAADLATEERTRKAARDTAETEKLSAETKEALARAGYDESQAGLNKLLADYEKSAQDSEKLLRDPNANLTMAERTYHAIHVATARHLPADAADLLLMDPETRAKYLGAKTTKATNESLESTLKLGEMAQGVRHEDGTYLTPQEMQEYIKSGGEMKKGWTTVSGRDEAARDRQLDAIAKQANAAMLTAEGAKADHFAQAYKTLEEAAILRATGGKTASTIMESILKGFEAVRTAQLGGYKIDKKIVQELENNLAAALGLNAVEVKRLFGLWTSRSFVPGEKRPEDNNKVDTDANTGQPNKPPPLPPGYEFGASIMPMLEEYSTRAVMGTGEKLMGLGSYIDNAIRGFGGIAPKVSGPSGVNPDVEAYLKAQREKNAARRP